MKRLAILLPLLSLAAASARAEDPGTNAPAARPDKPDAARKSADPEDCLRREMERVEKEWKERHPDGSSFPFEALRLRYFETGSSEGGEGDLGVLFDETNRSVQSDKLLDVLHRFDCPVGAVARCRGTFDLDRLANLDLRILHVFIDDRGGRSTGSPESLVGLPLTSFAWQGEGWTNVSVLARIPTLEYICIGNDGPVCDASPLAAIPSLEDLLLQGEWCFRDGRFPAKKLDFLSLTCNYFPTELPEFGGDRLSSVELFATSITNCSSLRNQPLETICIEKTPIRDLSFVRGKKSLWRLELRETEVRDLSPLKDTGLTYLSLKNNPVDGYEPIAELPLEYLIVTTNGWPVSVDWRNPAKNAPATPSPAEEPHAESAEGAE